MLCNDCALVFFQSPLKLGIVVLSVVVALVSLYFILRRDLSAGKKVLLVYVHVFALVFPFVFYGFFSGCQSFFSGCSRLLPTIYMLLLTGFVSAIIGSLAAPLIFRHAKSKSAMKISKGHAAEFVREESKLLGIKAPGIYLVDSAKPIAFSFSNISPVIFISAGMLDLLERKEAEAVLLHELMHVKSGTSLLKFSAFFLKLFSPLSMFASFRHELNGEELKADRFAVLRQGTFRHLSSAKGKVNSYFEFSNGL